MQKECNIIGLNNELQVAESATLENVKITIKGNNNKIIFPKNSFVHDFVINMTGNNHTFLLGIDCDLWGGEVDFEDNNNSFIVGKKGAIHHNFYAALCENNKSIIIGEECLFSNSVRMRVADSHAIIDVNTKKLINRGKSIILKDRVWVGEYVHFFKGGIVGSNSVVGACSVVTSKEFPDNCVIAGNPARVIKTNTTWQRLRILEDI